jgi:hypothetical protein
MSKKKSAYGIASYDISSYGKKKSSYDKKGRAGPAKSTISAIAGTPFELHTTKEISPCTSIIWPFLLKPPSKKMKFLESCFPGFVF